jgi:hypothetical protein
MTMTDMIARAQKAEAEVARLRVDIGMYGQIMMDQIARIEQLEALLAETHICLASPKTRWIERISLAEKIYNLTTSARVAHPREKG